MLKALSKMPKSPGLSKPGKSDTQKSSRASKVTKIDETKAVGLSKEGKPVEKVGNIYTYSIFRLICSHISFCYYVVDSPLTILKYR